MLHYISWDEREVTTIRDHTETLDEQHCEN